jgi:prophage antirepressor-like protein
VPNQITPFDFNGINIRTMYIGEQPWFVASDVCTALGYVNTSKAVADHLDEDERSHEQLDRSRMGSKSLIINESGLYSLVLSSRMPEAKRFKKWVTSEVLPAIRRNGQYQAEWYTKRHAIASTSKVQSAILQEVRKAIGKATEAVHYMNEHKLINSLLTGEYKGLDREIMSIYEMDFLAHFEVRNAILIGMNTDYAKRKALLIEEAKEWKAKNKPRIEPTGKSQPLPL